MQLKEAIQIRIRELCSEHNLTLSGLSAICGITKSTLDNLMCGRNNSMTVSTIQKICDGLEIDLPDFFDSELFSSKNLDRLTPLRPEETAENEIECETAAL